MVSKLTERKDTLVAIDMLLDSGSIPWPLTTSFSYSFSSWFLLLNKNLVAFSLMVVKEHEFGEI